MAIHPRLRARDLLRTKSSREGQHVVVLAPAHRAWVAEGLEETPFAVEWVTTVAEAVEALVAGPPPRPQMLIIDAEALSAGEVLELHAIREQGWFGTLLAIGRVSLALRKSLGVDRALVPGRDRLRPIVLGAGEQTVAATIRIPKISG